MPVGKQVPRILVVDDDESVCGALELILGEDYELVPVASAESALHRLAESRFDLIMLDITLAGDMNGFELFRIVREKGISLPVVMVTSDSSSSTMIKSIDQYGAAAYISKPPDIKKTLKTVEDVLNHEGVTVQEGDDTDDGIVGESGQIKRVRSLIRYAAPTDLAVLIEGKTGVGKELVAKAIHRFSSRRHGPFVVVNCAAVPEGVLESELFGHERGAFTDAKYQRKGKFEISNGGTLFIDEVGEVGPAVQVKLLRVLQEKTFARVGSNEGIEVDVRIIAATNRNIKLDVRSGRFRDDLYYRLSGVVFQIPSLDDRKEDIRPLVQHFLTMYRRSGSEMMITDKAIEMLVRRSWKGNVRELENAVRRGVAFTRGNVVDVENFVFEDEIGDFPASLPPKAEAEGAIRDNNNPWDKIGEAIEHLLQLEKENAAENVECRGPTLERKLKQLLSQAALKQTGGNHSQAGRLLGVDHKTVFKWKNG